MEHPGWEGLEAMTGAEEPSLSVRAEEAIASAQGPDSREARELIHKLALMPELAVAEADTERQALLGAAAASAVSAEVWPMARCSYNLSWAGRAEVAEEAQST